jgi:dCTP deaminase
MLSAKALARLIRQHYQIVSDRPSGAPGKDVETGIAVVPVPDLDKLEANGGVSIDLRLGRWFASMKQSDETHIDCHGIARGISEARLMRSYFVPYGADFVIHPGRFTLAATLEWIRLPKEYGAYVIGKSTLGRRGVVIETAAGVHPGFSGCLTLEIANVGEMPVKLTPGMEICQLFVHSVQDTLERLTAHFKPRSRRPR